MRWRRKAERGLSPRVRGNPQLERREPLLGGSIPACAGEPRKARSSADSV